MYLFENKKKFSNKLSHPKTPKKDQKKGINKNKSHQQSSKFFL
jgi:hypothetical protein